MRIDSISLHMLELPLVRTFRTSGSVRDSITHVVVHLRADSAEGWGECAAPVDPYYCPETAGTCWHVLTEFLVPMVLGHDWATPADLAQSLSRVKGNHFAKAGLEMAAWDAWTRAQGLPLAAALGGTRPHIASGVSLGIEAEPAALFEQIDRYTAEGYRRVKLKIAPGHDIEVVRATRARYPDLPLQVDANSAYTLRDIEHLKQLDAFNLLLIEQPLAHDDIIDHAVLQKQLKTPICLDESLHSLDDVRKAIDLDACRVVNIKVGRVGGFTEAIRIHDFCRARGVPVWCGGMHEFGIGRAANVALASLPGFTLPGDVSGSDKYYHEDIVEPPIIAHDGMITVPTSPGLGHDVALERVRRYETRTWSQSIDLIMSPQPTPVPDNSPETRQHPMLDALRALVELESPSQDKPALDHLANHLATLFEASGARVEQLPNATSGNHLRCSWQATSPTPSKPILVLCHFDTVWPIGTLTKMPFRIQGPHAFGPGIYDMKASLVMLAFALRNIVESRRNLTRPIIALLTSDEEIGSPTSRALIEETARSAEFVLVLEPPLPDGSLKTHRKGVGNYTLQVTGRAAHAGVEPEKGASAIVELAHQILMLQALNDPNAGVSVNVGTISGGSATNVVPAAAQANIDVRVRTLDQATRIDNAIQTLQPKTPGTSLHLTGGLNRPPMVSTAATAALFAAAQSIGGRLNLHFGEGGTGGGSDGNFTAALGIPTLDGLGCPGDGAHAKHEHIHIESLLKRTELLAELLLALNLPSGPSP